MVIAYLGRRLVGAAVATLVLAMPSAASASYLFWQKPDFSGLPVTGAEPDIGLPMPKATPKELQAHLMWNLRAGLNVAALQCQFSPSLMTVRNYNELLRHHAKELQGAYAILQGYFKRTGGKRWQTAFDQYTTKTYNGFSTMHAQLGFCETAGLIGRDALGRRKGELHLTATEKLREFRNSLVPKGDGIFRFQRVLAARQLPPLDPQCWDKRNRFRDNKCSLTAQATLSMPDAG